MGQNPGSIMGHENRPAFTDKASRNSFTPGPGNYKLPTEFAHYKKMTPYIWFIYLFLTIVILFLVHYF